MKTVIIVIILLIAAIAGAGYYGLPILIEKETSGLKSEIHDVKERIQKIEDFIKKEEEARKVGQLPSDADIQRIIKTVNTLFSKATSLEESLKREFSSVQETVKKQGTVTEEALKNQTETMDKSLKEIQSRIQKIMFDAAMATVRGHILKVQVELKSKNLGTAKTELDLIHQIFEKTKMGASDEEKKTIEGLQGALKKAKDEMDMNLPAAINRIDLLWHEMGKLIRKG
ncbi:MAG: hypothetical protein AB1502_11330 [Thermodesulfobacteriota bacterium]